MTGIYERRFRLQKILNILQEEDFTIMIKKYPFYF